MNITNGLIHFVMQKPAEEIRVFKSLEQNSLLYSEKGKESGDTLYYYNDGSVKLRDAKTDEVVCSAFLSEEGIERCRNYLNHERAVAASRRVDPDTRMFRSNSEDEDDSPFLFFSDDE